MLIHGLQKMTLLDFPGHVACTVFLGGCDMRCPFCHNAELLDARAPALMDEEGLFEFLKKRKGLLDGVAFTGGEPMLRKDLPDVAAKIKEMGFLVKVDTNGNHPDMLKRFIDEGLADHIAMDIKNSRELYGKTCGIEGFDIGRIEKSIGLLLDGKCSFEFRTTCIRQFHDESSFEGIAQWIDGAENYFLQNFVDRESVPFAGLSGFTKEELEEFEKIVKPHVRNTGIRGV